MAHNPKSAENGRKGGRPRGSIANHTRTAIEAKKAFIERFMAVQEPIDNALLAKAMDGDVQAIKEVYDRAYGKSKDSVDMNIKERLEIKDGQFGQLLRRANKRDSGD